MNREKAPLTPSLMRLKMREFTEFCPKSTKNILLQVFYAETEEGLVLTRSSKKLRKGRKQRELQVIQPRKVQIHHKESW